MAIPVVQLGWEVMEKNLLSGGTRGILVRTKAEKQVGPEAARAQESPLGGEGAVTLHSCTEALI